MRGIRRTDRTLQPANSWPVNRNGGNFQASKLRWESHHGFSRACWPVIQGITVMGDVIRPDGRGQPGGVDRTTVWLFDAIKRQLNLACGLPVDVITANGIPALHAWLGTLRSPSAAHRYWARLPV